MSHTCALTKTAKERDRGKQSEIRREKENEREKERGELGREMKHYVTSTLLINLRIFAPLAPSKCIYILLPSSKQ